MESFIEKMGMEASDHPWGIVVEEGKHMHIEIRSWPREATRKSPKDMTNKTLAWNVHSSSTTKKARRSGKYAKTIT